MDAHAENWRFYRDQVDALVHLVLPSTFLRLNHVSIDNTVIYSAQTRFADGIHVSKPIRVHGNLGSDRGDVSSGLAISLPLVLTKGTFDPRNVVSLKIYSSSSKNTQFLYFFYQTFLQALGTQEVGDLNPAPSSAVEVAPMNPLDKIMDQALNTSSKVAPASAFNFLRDLLKSNTDTPPRHHQALELPGVVRGKSQEPQDESVLLEAPMPPPLKIHLNMPLERLHPDQKHFVRHLISGHKFIICEYLALPNKVSYGSVAAVDTAQAGQTSSSGSLQVLTTEFTLLSNVQNAFVDTLEEACAHLGFKVTQQVPILIPKSGNYVTLLKDHFYEACFVLRTAVSESSAWVKACLSTHNRQEKIWADFFQLWELGPPQLGVELSMNIKERIDPNINEQRFWASLLDHPNVRTVLEGAAYACVIVHYTLTAWLLLPGGFAIKGYYTVSEDNFYFLAARWLPAESV